ncbi:MAG: glycosyl transferase [Alphaproteobacteria bacterium CG_4_9_14_3_um_filter_47_13]|nr:MAG: glycosyl transferase [Alphaproteobacteria bacterium CG_4_9_14_3_um_filter_47_13]
MTSLLFVRKPQVYLPEIKAYKDFLASRYPFVKVSESLELEEPCFDDFDIVWHFMGFDKEGKGRYVVHEYNSLSAPPVAKLKNRIKGAVNKRPDRRIFLNARVQQDFGFKDNVPAHLRDMGIDEGFFNITKKPVYDFILAGGLNRGAVITKVLDCFASGALQDASILLVGDAPPEIEAKYKSVDNIILKGRIAYQDMPSIIGQARYGLNIQPDIYPFNVQTSTKLIEYCAAGLPVVTTDYLWMRDFEAVRGGSFFKLSTRMDNLSLEAVQNFDFKTPDVTMLKWNHIIAESGIFSFLDE